MKVKKKVLKQEIINEFMYRAKYGRTYYSMEEVIYIVSGCIDDIAWEIKHKRQNALNKEDE